LKVRLTIELMNAKPMNVVVDKESFIIGRSQKCDVLIPVEGVSRHHCQVDINQGEIFVTDLESANGVYIDDMRIAPNEKTRYLTTSKLTCGTAEIVEFSFIDESPSLVDVNQLAPAMERGTGSMKRVRPASLQKNKQPSSNLEKTFTELHPSVKALLVLVLLGVGYFVFNNIFNEGSSEDDELYQMQHDAAMKNRKNDGSVKTINF